MSHDCSQIRTIAQELLIDEIGFAPLEEIPEGDIKHFESWLLSGNHGDMCYLEKYKDLRQHPQLLFPEANSVIVIAVSYYPVVQQNPSQPQIAKYALGRDYHKVIKKLLNTLGERISAEVAPHSYRAIVDTAPFFERYWAERSGIGFIGNNKNLIVPNVGSFVFLGELLTSLELTTDRSCNSSCGKCDKCARACPMSALTAEGLVARRCINYLTIEHRGEIPEELSSHFGNRLYGCDTCQDVCPYNRSPRPTSHFPSFSQLIQLRDDDLIPLDEDTYHQLFYGTSMTRAKLEGMQRNAQIYLNHKGARANALE